MPVASISVVIPTLNEEANVADLVRRLGDALGDYRYELIFIDDHSSDATLGAIQQLQHRYPIRFELKKGKPGKSYSLLQGFSIAKHDIIVMIDADLQYPPEALKPMVDMLVQDEADVVVANRSKNHTGAVRRFTTRTFNAVSGALMKLDVDVQSGMKVFRKKVIRHAKLNPKSGWTLDLELLTHARDAGYRIAGYDVEFAQRTAGESKVKWLKVSKDVGISTLALRFRPADYVPLYDSKGERVPHGFHYRGKQYSTYTAMEPQNLAVDRTTFAQQLFLFGLVLFAAAGMIIDWYTALFTIVTLVTLVYFSDLLLNLYLIARSFYKNEEIRPTDQQVQAQREWPRYTVFCPLYKETSVVPQFVDAMSQLDYPKDKLEVMLLLEEDDTDTIAVIRSMNLPDFFKIMVVPHGLPKTKPKACNYGLAQATGEYSVIYDAEDIPDPLQLKKAVLAFEQSGPEIGCVQAKLNYYNWNQNILTRLFTLEYSLWFNLVLTGLQSIYSVIPLGGTSNHFRTSDLRALDGWDPFNVTEDADLGIRIVKRNMRTAILDSTTLEEANCEYGNWLKQRSRWIKGYMQTYLVHMRRPSAITRQRHALTFQVIMGAKTLVLFLNPLLWVMTLTYFFLPGTREFIESLYLTPVFYMGTVTLVMGNFLYMYYYMVGAAKQNRPELILFALLIPFYWLMMSWAAFMALRDLILRPHHWHKTKHGLHLKQLQETTE
jgi:cellulose synthase/poly-beta-1,6-N-acetylglucosamine synthase-like glycosyltransferase